MSLPELSDEHVQASLRKLGFSEWSSQEVVKTMVDIDGRTCLAVMLT